MHVCAPRPAQRMHGPKKLVLLKKSVPFSISKIWQVFLKWQGKMFEGATTTHACDLLHVNGNSMSEYCSSSTVLLFLTREHPSGPD